MLISVEKDTGILIQKYIIPLNPDIQLRTFVNVSCKRPDLIRHAKAENKEHEICINNIIHSDHSFNIIL